MPPTPQSQNIYNRVFVGWFILAMALTVGWMSAQLKDGYVGDHSFVSAHFSVMARNFAEQGVLQLKATPVQEVRPFGDQIDYYLHWPPLFPILLSLFFRVFGSTYLTALIFMIFLILINGLLVFSLLKKSFSLQAGAIGGMIYFCSPITLKYGLFVLHLHLAITFTLLAAIAFLGSFEDSSRKRWFFIGILSTVLALFTSWEPVFFFLGCFLAALFFRKKQGLKTATIFLIVSVLAAVLVCIHYCLAHPKLVQEFTEVVSFRLGMSNSYHARAKEVAPGLLEVLLGYFDYLKLVEPFGWIGLLAVIGYFISMRRKIVSYIPVLLTTGMLMMWLAWFAILRNHAFFHEYQMLLSVPCCAFGGGIVAHWLWSQREGRFDQQFGSYIKLLSSIILPIAILLPVIGHTVKQISIPHGQQRIMHFADQVKRITEPESIIFSDTDFMLPSFYSNLKFQGAITDSNKLPEIIKKTRTEFGEEVPIYFALYNTHNRNAVKWLVARHKVIYNSDLLLLFSIQ